MVEIYRWMEATRFAS